MPKKKAEAKEFILKTPVLATTYLPVQACYQVRIAADEQRIQIRPKSAAGGLQKYQLRDLEERLKLPEDVTPTVNNARRPNLSRRFSQSIRRSWRSKFSTEDEEKSIVNESESTEKVKPAVKRRDWSGELDDDDVQGRRSPDCKENCIISAESATDIGRYWRFITSND